MQLIKKQTQHFEYLLFRSFLNMNNHSTVTERHALVHALIFYMCASSRHLYHLVITQDKARDVETLK